MEEEKMGKIGENRQGGGENDDGNRGYLWHCQSTASAKIRFCNFLIKIWKSPKLYLLLWQIEHILVRYTIESGKLYLFLLFRNIVLSSVVISTWCGRSPACTSQPASCMRWTWPRATPCSPSTWSSWTICGCQISLSITSELSRWQSFNLRYIKSTFNIGQDIQQCTQVSACTRPHSTFILHTNVFNNFVLKF